MLPKLVESGYEIYGEQQLKRYAQPKKLTSSTLNVKSNEQWFELEGEMTFGDTTIDMNDIRSVLVRGKPFVQLQDGSTGELTENWLNRFKKLMHLMPDEQRSRLPKIAAPAIEEIGEAANEYTADFAFEDYADRLREFEDIEPVDAPKVFNGELRPYQRAGLSWMYFLHQYDFGGILADDMGLGKTVQVLALL
jgi:non-specific serine/threonine protein kinase